MPRPAIASHLLVLLPLALLTACSGGGGNAQDPGGGSGGAGGGAPRPIEGAPVAAALTAEQQAEAERLLAAVAATKDINTAKLLGSRALPFKSELGYDPSTAANLPLLAGSALKLNAAETAALDAQGFVISDRQRFPHFGYAYETIYAEDLPVFISADSILEAVHQSYDEILKAVEVQALMKELTALLQGMRARLPQQAGIEAATRKDLDLFLAVGLSLLQDSPAPPVASAKAGAIDRLVGLAKEASGAEGLELFGLEREIDFSQFKPRGHYVDSPELEAYFRAMMWFGRIDFPMLHTQGTGEVILVRRSVQAALALRALMDEAALARFGRIDDTIRAFVGEPDSMSPLDVPRLQADLGITGADISGIDDATLAATIVKGAYGNQKILSQIVMQAPHAGTWPLDATFLFMGQRYVFDSHVFSNVVYDRVNPTPPAQKRMLPDPLDVAYAALANDQAVSLLAEDLETHAYAPALESMRVLGDAHPPGFWDANLYNIWLSSLRALSLRPADAAGLPAVAQTEAFGRRMLNTQLASWAELRHDTILYAKQSYTTGIACEYPDAYVEPYPAFFARIEAFAKKGAAVVGALPIDAKDPLSKSLTSYFATLSTVAGTLREMAERQRTGMPHSAEHLAFINEAVRLQHGCGGPAGITGWYGKLFFSAWGAATFDPVVADVHTAPTDASGGRVGWVMHVGTGWARLMVVTVETCMGPRAYVGAVSSFHQKVTTNLQRLTDEQWRTEFTPDQQPMMPAWLDTLLTR